MLVSELLELLDVKPEIQRSLFEFVLGAEEISKRFHAAVQPLFIKLPEIVESLEELAKSIQLAEEYNERLRASGYSGALHIFPIGDVTKFTGTNEEFDNAVYAKTIDSEFCNEIIALIKESRVISHRSKLIEEAILLHKNGQFYGSITLSLSQIEGIFNDFLIYHGIASYDESGGLVADKKKIIGMNGKIAKIKTAKISENELLDDLETSNFSSKNSNIISINSFRNAILHGSNTDFGSQRLSTQTILWLYAEIIDVSYTETINMKTASQPE